MTITPDPTTSSRESSPFSDIVHFDKEENLDSISSVSVNADLESPCYSVISELDYI